MDSLKQETWYACKTEENSDPKNKIKYLIYELWAAIESSNVIAIHCMSSGCFSVVERNILSLLQLVSSMKELKQAHALINKTGLNDHSPAVCRMVSFSSLSASGSLEYARSIFETTTVKDSFLYNTMIRAYAQSISPIEAIRLYNQMHRMNVKSDNFTYPFVLKACARVSVVEENGGAECIRKGAELHCRIILLDLDSDTFVTNSLILMYSKCGSLDMARRIFDEMPVKTVASWNTMIAAYDRCNDFMSADFLFGNNPGKNVVSWNTMITRHVKSGNIAAAEIIFERMPERDAASWNAMIAGYIQSRKYRRALEIFHEMQINGVQPTEITIILVLSACAETGALEIGREIHGLLKQNMLKIEGILESSLLDMYAKCGSLKQAREIFDGMTTKNVICWNSMIVALAVHGHSEEALDLFSSMEKQVEVRPNGATFMGVLIACSHKGLVDAGHYFFHRMIDVYKIRPHVKHYGCMVDLLSRWGLLDEAYNLIKRMPFKANGVLWRTLLGACWTYKNVGLAEDICRNIAELEPLKDSDYILLSNIYADVERWKDVELVRGKMIDLGVWKKPGCSHIELK